MTIALLVDNDIVIKLSKMGIYQPGIVSVGGSPGRVGSLGVMMRYMGLSDESRRIKLTGDREAADRLNTALQSIIIIEMSNEESQTAASLMKAALENDLDLDGGEVALMAIAICNDGMDVATGDKRALRSLPSLTTSQPVVSRLRQRFICLEQIVKRLCKAHGISFIRSAIVKSPRADSAITYVYSEISAGESSRFIGAMELMIREQVEKSAPGWLKTI